MPCALGDSTHRQLVEPVLAAVGTHRFAASVAGDEVLTASRPDPYQVAAALLGVDPARCVALEDSPTGVASAEAAGCMTVAVPSLRHRARTGPHRRRRPAEVTLTWLLDLAEHWHARAFS